MSEANRDSILGRSGKGRVEPIECPALGGTVYVRQMTASEHDAMQNAAWEERRAARKEGRELRLDYRGLLLAYSLSDASGKRLFAAAEAPLLGAIPYLEVEPACEKASALNVTDVEAAVKNSDAAPAGDSPSA